jgi:murein DD-endopeptidase MepM/ murein hydrolase activator NlpD
MRDAASGSVVVPAVLVGGTVVALAALRSRRAAPADGGDDGGRNLSNPSGGGGGASGEDAGTGPRWVWPLPRWNGYTPAISDGFNSLRTVDGQKVKHQGVDVMYRRASATDQTERYPAGSKHGSRGFFVPDATPVLAVRDAKVWSAGMTPRGYTVVLDHGPPWASYYTHMSEMFIAPTQRGASGQRVRAGDVIGHVGADPLDGEGLMHLHFELWFKGARNAAIDPQPLMATWLVAPARVTLVAST